MVAVILKDGVLNEVADGDKVGRPGAVVSMVRVVVIDVNANARVLPAASRIVALFSSASVEPAGVETWPVSSLTVV